MIRGHLLKELEQALADLPHFRVNDFLIDTEPLEEGDETELTIRYRYNKDYWFISTIPYQQVEVQGSIKRISYMGYSI